jgi:hypothetical protein
MLFDKIPAVGGFPPCHYLQRLQLDVLGFNRVPECSGSLNKPNTSCQGLAFIGFAGSPFIRVNSSVSPF